MNMDLLMMINSLKILVWPPTDIKMNFCHQKQRNYTLICVIKYREPSRILNKPNSKKD